MSDWLSKPIGALLRAQFPGEWGADPNAPGELARVFRGADFVASGRLERSGGALRSIAPAKLKKLELTPGDILLEKSGGSPDQPVGRVSYFEGANSRAVASNFLQTLRPADEVDSKFLFYLLQHEYARGRVLPFQQQTTGIINFRLKDYLKERVKVPASRDEQRRIANLLSAVDEQIESVEATLEKKRKTLEAIRSSLIDNHSTKSPIPADWEGALGARVKFKGGNGFPEWMQGQVSGDLPFYKVSDMNTPGNEISLSVANNYVSAGDARKYGWTVISANSVVFAKVGAALLSNRRRLLSGDSLIDNNMMAATPGEGVRLDYLYWLLRGIDFRIFVQDGAVPSVNQGQLSSLRISLPSLDNQERAARLLDEVEADISLELGVLSKLRQLKSGLSRDLLLGDAVKRNFADIATHKT